MLYRSQNKDAFFCFGRGCSLEADGAYVYAYAGGGGDNKTLLGVYDDKDSAVLALKKMYYAIGKDDKMDAPSAEEIRKEIAREQIWEKRREEAAERKKKTEARRRRETPIKELSSFPYTRLLKQKGYETIEEVERATDEELLSIRSIGPQKLGMLRNSVETYRRNQKA